MPALRNQTTRPHPGPACRTRIRRHGYSLVETVVALSLSSFIMAVIAGICLAQMRLARAAAKNAESAEAVRTVTAVLSGEARRLTPVDVGAASSDSLVLRAFRGSAVVCGASPGGVRVRYSGDRLPDPSKDSVLVLSNGVEAVVALLDYSAAASTCSMRPGEQLFTFDTSLPVPDSAVLLLFERGSYHLRDRALRYRVGAGGRQPLTAEALRHPGSRFDNLAADGIRFTLDVQGRASSHAAAFQWRVQP